MDAEKVEAQKVAARALQEQIDALVKGKEKPASTAPPRSLRDFIREGMGKGPSPTAAEPKRRRKDAPKSRQKKRR